MTDENPYPQFVRFKLDHCGLHGYETRKTYAGAMQRTEKIHEQHYSGIGIVHWTTMYGSRVHPGSGHPNWEKIDRIPNPHVK